MSALSLLTPNSIKRATSTLSFCLFRTECFSYYSTICRRNTLFAFPPTNPPCPKKVPFKVSAHGHTWDDPYHWMSNVEDPDFLAHLKQENSYAEAFMADTDSKQRELFLEMSSRLPAKISTPPERWGPWLYYQYIPSGKEYPTLCRKLFDDQKGWVKAIQNFVKVGRTEEILLDWNEIAEIYGYVHVGTCRISPDHNFLAYTIDTVGSEQFMLQVKDLRDGHIVLTVEDDAVVSLAWAEDSSTLFYTISDKNQRPYRK